MDWLWNLQDPDEWSALAAMLGLLLTLAAATFAVVQILDARSLRREQAAPYVIVKLDENEALSGFMDFVVVNIGTTPAFDISIDIDPPMVRANEIAEFPFMNSRAIANGIKMLVPGQEIRFHFDTAAERHGAGLPSIYTARVNARNSKSKALPVGIFELDADWKRNSVHVDIRNLHSIGGRIEGIDKTLKDALRIYKQHSLRRPE